MDHQIAVGVGNGLAHFEKKAAALLDGRVAIAEPGVDGLLLHVFQHQVGAALRSASAVDQPRDVGVVEIGENLALAPEPVEQLGRVQAVPDQLERGLLPELLVVADRQIDGAHAAAPDFPHHAPGAQTRADDRVGAEQRLRGVLQGGGDALATGLVRHQQGFDFLAQHGMDPAGGVEKALLLLGREVGGGQEELLDLLPIIGRHRLAFQSKGFHCRTSGSGAGFSGAAGRAPHLLA